MSIKGFVIRKLNDVYSEELSDDCVKSALQFNINVEKTEGVYNDFDNKMLQENLSINPGAFKKFKSSGVKGCFLSHYNLWKKCVDLNEPIIIFEHDGVMINPLPNDVLNRFDDYLNLDYARHIHRREMGVYETSIRKSDNINILKLEPKEVSKVGFKFMNKNHIVGAHGYILKPSGAKKIIEGIKTDGICPADIAPNLKYIEMYYTDTTVVRVNEKMLNANSKKSHTKESWEI